MRFADLEKIVGFATTTSRSLKLLEGDSLITRRVLNELHRPVAYSLTDRGKQLCELLIEIEKL